MTGLGLDELESRLVECERKLGIAKKAISWIIDAYDTAATGGGLHDSDMRVAREVLRELDGFHDDDCAIKDAQIFLEVCGEFQEEK